MTTPPDKSSPGTSSKTPTLATKDLDKKSSAGEATTSVKLSSAEQGIENPKPSSTVFVSNLPTSLSSESLLKRASSIGPVRDAFVVSDSKTKQSRGFGYVKFVLREDAEAALKEGLGQFENHSKTVLVTWAKPKLHPDQKIQKEKEKSLTKLKRSKDTTEGNEEGQGSPPEKKRKVINPIYQIKKDFNSNKIVVVQGLPTQSQNSDIKPESGEQPAQSEKDLDDGSGQGKEPMSTSGVVDQLQDSSSEITTKVLYKKARKFARLENVEFPVSGPQSATTACAHFIFSDPTAAAIAQTKLHGHIYKGHFITTAIKSRLDALTRLGHGFGGRLIVRNLEFGVTEQDLRYIFAPFGTIHSINIPTVVKDGKESKTRGKGFAFVWMISEADASRALKGLNGKNIYAGISHEAIKNDTDGQKKSKKRKESKDVEKPEDRGRIITVDWALSKKKFEEAENEKKANSSGNTDLRSKTEGGSGEEDEEDDDFDDDDDDDDDDDSNDDNESSDAGEDSGTDASRLSDDGSNSDTKSRTSENAGYTLFVRNLSFEATEEELHALFRPFGPLRYARVVMDPKLGRSRGTGFVCLWNKEDAEKVLNISQKLENEGFGHGPPMANGQPSLLRPDPSSSLAGQLTLHGRVLGVSEAVSREKAEKLRIDRDKSGKGKDKRNLYLMKEGVIFPNSTEARRLHPADLETRQQSFDQRKALLRSNPSLYISFTRLSIRQIPLFVTERSLKRLARYALSQWRAEVKAGKRVDLTEEELSTDGKEKLEMAEVRSTKKIPKSKVKQVKVIRANEKQDNVLGVGKSKGYGFLEMDSHADALRVLRWANANPAVDRMLKEWTCEELEKTIQQNEKTLSKETSKKDDTKSESVPPLDENRIKKIKGKIEDLRSELKSNEKKKDKDKKQIERKPETSHIITHRMLIIEFAIENAQVVKKRLERKDKVRNATKKNPSNDVGYLTSVLVLLSNIS
ncbi:hypothetical protein BY996DRAFT_4631763 [Phakopsora pachyrhizi]|nr:hypothetical protein BY996DRAFT_4631763 [Phakopsora pachyrhizi]